MHPKHLSSYCASKMALWLELVPHLQALGLGIPGGRGYANEGAEHSLIYLFTALVVTLRLRPPR